MKQQSTKVKKQSFHVNGKTAFFSLFCVAYCFITCRASKFILGING